MVIVISLFSMERQKMTPLNFKLYITSIDFSDGQIIDMDPAVLRL